MSAEFCITSEEVTPGRPPEWLRNQIRLQAMNPNKNQSDLSGRILVVYPNETSRREMLSILELEGAVDTTLHHTIDSLTSSLLADFRLPRVIPKDGPYDIVLHAECQKEASSLGFPTINPLPEMNWGHGKTKALATLHSCLSRELAVENWDGPGMSTFRKVIKRLEKKLGGSHPDMVVQRIINMLQDGREPFSVSDIDGIVLMDHAPGMCKSHSEMVMQLSRHRPVHQLTYPGNFRLGHHGHLLVDEHPISEPSKLPQWINKSDRGTEKKPSIVHRQLLHRAEHSFDATIGLVSERLHSNPTDRIMIVDPSIGENRGKWERRLLDMGVLIPRSRNNLRSHPLAHWILWLSKLPHGPDAFSLESLRALSLQTTISPFEEPPEHPSDDSLRPTADPDLLTNLARSAHVLGGPGALSKWISTMSMPPSENQRGPAKERAQWWLLCVANSLRPVLGAEDRQALGEASATLGCFSGKNLPLPVNEKTGDEWLLKILSSIDIQSAMDNFDGESTSPASIIQTLLRSHRELRQMQEDSGQRTPQDGLEWVDDFSTIIDKSMTKGHGTKASGRVSLLGPSESLGCTADLTILTNTSSSSWNLKVPKVPFLGDEERNSLDILRPDGPIRDARHHLQHILNSSPEVVILDTILDESNPPAAPIREWAISSDSDCTKSEIPSERAPSTPRDFRQFDGRQIRNNLQPSRSPINPSAVSIGFDPELQADRQRRQPRNSIEDGYLPDSATPHLLSFESSSLFARTPKGVVEPRRNHRWPVIGGITGSGKNSVTIDPRPFTPAPSGSLVSDSRHGHAEGAEQNVRIWSPTRLQRWLNCPRMGWLSKGLMAENEELIDEEIDRRTQGNLLHLIHHDILSKALNIPMGEERETPGEARLTSLCDSGLSVNELMQMALESLDSRAPWLERADAVSAHSLRTLTGMDRKQWGSWLADPAPLPLSGRIGTIISAELTCSDSSPISLEWSTDNFNPNGIEIALPSEFTGGSQLEPIKIRGFIDRVDLLPFDEKSELWLDPEGDHSVAPIRIQGTGWKPRRIVAIRDLKTSDRASSRRRHLKGLLEELQLALYARAWEVAHPGDLVLAAGISMLSHNSEHYLEISSGYSENLPEIEIGTRTTVSADLHRFNDEGKSATSDHFRAWLAQRIQVSLKVALQASSGRVHPTPSPGVCGYCPVSRTCQVRAESGF